MDIKSEEAKSFAGVRRHGIGQGERHDLHSMRMMAAYHHGRANRFEASLKFGLADMETRD